MKARINFPIFIAMLLFSCNVKTKVEEKPSELVGTWRLLTGVLIEKGDTTTTDYTKDLKMIKIINETHFSFLNHDLKKGQDSVKVFVAGGGRYKLEGDQYTEYLEYCTDRAWEGHEFRFTVKIENDTLVQTGVEKIEAEGIERLNTETYVRDLSR